VLAVVAVLWSALAFAAPPSYPVPYVLPVVVPVEEVFPRESLARLQEPKGSPCIALEFGVCIPLGSGSSASQ
jgi:hypothetical protein